MKRLYIIVEGQTEEEFVKNMIAPYLGKKGIYDVRPILIHTSRTGKGGFVNYAYLRNDAKRLLAGRGDDFVVTMLVDYFRCPEVPFSERWKQMTNHERQVEEMEKCIGDDINDSRFIPYIQLHEFEALLFSSNVGFMSYFTDNEQKETERIVKSYPNPEDINSTPEGAPSKRILSIRKDYDKVLIGNLIALSIGMETIMKKCPRFNRWIEAVVKACSE